MPRHRAPIESLAPVDQAVARLSHSANTPSQVTAAMAVAVWWNAGSGFLACLLDEKWNEIPGSTTFDYHPTAEAAILQLEQDRQRGYR